MSDMLHMRKKKLKCPLKHDLPILLLRPLGECYRVGYVYSCRRTFEAETLKRSQNWCRVLTPGELSFDRWHKLKKPLVKDKPTFTKFQDPQERQKLKLACSLKNFFKKPISLATSKSLRPSCLIFFFPSCFNFCRS